MVIAVCHINLQYSALDVNFILIILECFWLLIISHVYKIPRHQHSYNLWTCQPNSLIDTFLYFICRDLDAENRMMMDYYIKPWARYQSYGVGVLFGYALWFCQSRHNGRLPINRVWYFSFPLSYIKCWFSYIVSNKRLLEHWVMPFDRHSCLCVALDPRSF